MKEEQDIYNLPKGWIWVSLSDIVVNSKADIVDGPFGSNLKSSDYQDKGIPVFKIQNIKAGHFLDKNIQYVTSAKSIELERHSFKEGDIIITKLGEPLGLACKVPAKYPFGIIVADLIRLRPSKIIDTDYLLYLINSEIVQNQLKNITKGTTRSRVNLTQVRSIKIPLTGMGEQKAIVSQIKSLFSRLDEAESMLNKASGQLKIYKQSISKKAFEGKLTEHWRMETNPEPAKRILDDIDVERQTKFEVDLSEWKSAIIDWEKDSKQKIRPSRPSKPIVPDKTSEEHKSKMWDIPSGWEWTQLGFITFVTKLAGFEYTKYVKYTEKGDLPVIKAENVGAKGFKKTKYSKVVAESVSHLKRSQLYGGELIIVFVGAGTGNVGTIPQNNIFFLGPNIGMARPYGNIDSKFLEYFYQSPRGKDLLLVSAKAVAQPSLSMGNIRQTPFAIPSKQEQLAIVQMLDYQFTLVENLEKSITTTLDNIIILRHSLLKRAFEGRIVNYNSNESVLDLLKILDKERIEHLKIQKQIPRAKTKQTTQMKEKKSLLEILKESKSPITVQELWENSSTEGDVERFYSELKEIADQIVEIKSETESLLSFKNEN